MRHFGKELPVVFDDVLVVKRRCYSKLDAKFRAPGGKVLEQFIAASRLDDDNPFSFAWHVETANEFKTIKVVVRTPAIKILNEMRVGRDLRLDIWHRPKHTIELHGKTLLNFSIDGKSLTQAYATPLCSERGPHAVN